MQTARTIEELCKAVVDCPHSTPKWTDEGVVVLRSTNIRNGRLDLSSPSYTDEEHYRERVRRAVPEPGDLVLTREAPMGEVCMIPEGLRCCLGQRMVLLKPDTSRVNPRYLLYAIQSRQVQSQILASEGTGSTVSNLRIPLLKALRIPHHSLPSQETIADILGALDDKIELNRRMSETLEEIVRETYKAWFSEVSNGMHQRESVSSPPSASHSGRLDDLAQEHKRGVRPEEMPPETPYIGLEHMPRRRTTLDTWGHAGDISSNKSAFHRGEILFGKLRPYFHKVGVAPADGICSTDIVVVAPKNDDYFGFVLATLSSDEFVQFTDSSSTGTRMPRTSWKSMASYEVQIPPLEVAREFNDFVRPMVERNISATFESRTLAELRDTLLPKLISGELRIPDAEKLVSEVT